MKSKQPKNVPNDKDWYSEDNNAKGVKSFGRRIDKGRKSFGTARGGGAATKGKKFLKD